MHLKYHFAVGLIIGIPIYYYTNNLWNFLLFFAGTFLIDSDHYLLGAWVTKDLNIFTSYKYWMHVTEVLENGGSYPYVNFIFHSIETFTVAIVAGAYFNNYFLAFGMFVHYIMDIAYMLNTYGQFFGLKRWSLFQRYWDHGRMWKASPRNRKSKKGRHTSKGR